MKAQGLLTLLAAVGALTVASCWSRGGPSEKRTACMGAKNIAGEVKLYKRDHC
jgi:hypothetical protein